MNPIIKEQLNKCKIANIPPYDEGTTEMIIKKQSTVAPSSTTLRLSHRYKISVENYIIHPFDGFTLHDNWNNGNVPTDQDMIITVTQCMGKMIKVESVGVNDGSNWVGWLPQKSIKYFEEI